MAKQFLGPYINFQGQAKDAMDFYHGVLGGELNLYSSDEHGKPKPAGPGDRIMYGRLVADGIVIVASDGNPKYPAKVGDHIGISIGGTDSAHLHQIFEGLAKGGQVKMPLTTGAWGGTAGWLTDRFGINWNIDIESDQF